MSCSGRCSNAEEADEIRADGHVTDHAAVFLLEVLLTIMAACCGSCLLVYAALAVGHSFSSHKLAWSVGAYFAISYGMGAVFSVAMVLYMGLVGEQWLHDLAHNMPEILRALLGVILVPTLIKCAVAYPVTAYFLQKKLNLE